MYSPCYILKPLFKPKNNLDMVFLPEKQELRASTKERSRPVGKLLIV